MDVPGVREVRYDPEDMKVVIVTFDKDETTADAIVEALKEGGEEIDEVLE